LGLLTVVNFSHGLTFSCRRCWATLRLNPSQFVSATLVGGLAGIGIVVAVALVSHLSVYDSPGIFSIVVAAAALAGRFLPALEVEDPPT
jgi:hypothetical protein